MPIDLDYDFGIINDYTTKTDNTNVPKKGPTKDRALTAEEKRR